MSLPKAYDKRMKTALGLHAVWLPGNPIEIGSVLVRQDGIFREHDDLASFGISPTLQQFPDQRTLNFQSAGTRTLTFQAGVKVDPAQLQPNVSAELKIEFTKTDSYLVRASGLTGVEIEGIRPLAKKLAAHPDWKHGQFFLAWQIYEAEPLSFLGSQQNNKKVSFSGNGSAVLKFLELGVSVGLTKTGSVAVDITGKKGPIAMAVLRVKPNGDVVHV